MSVMYATLYRSTVDEQHRLISYTRPCPSVALLDFLKYAADGEGRFLWERDGDVFAGFGAAAEIVAYGQDRFQAIKQQAQQLFAHALVDTSGDIVPRLFGGFSFRDDFAATGIWSAFPAAYFVLPRYQLTRQNGQLWLTINHLCEACDLDDEFDAIQNEFSQFIHWMEAAPPPPPSARPQVESLTYPLPLEAWQSQVNTATRQMRTGNYKKVVLSRTCDITFDRPVNPLLALETLQRSYPNAYRFLIEALPGHAFFGATPELLASVEGSTLHTAALASSRPRGRTTAEDEALAAELLATPKERHEHQVVVESLRDSLTPLARWLDIPEAPSLYRLSNIQHLYTPIKAELEGEYNILDVVEKLHPTPALGGYPRKEAMDAIKRLETVDRGWYASPVGWLDAKGNGTFAVAIRSAVSQGEGARLYAGAGIVLDSDPDKEWDETGLKFRPLFEALGVHPDARTEP